MATTLTRSPGAPPQHRRALIVVCAVAVLVVASAVIGAWLQTRIDMKLHATPLFARWKPRIGFGFVLAVAVGALVVWGDRRWAPRFRFGHLLVACAAAAAAWGVSLALVDGARGLTMGIANPLDYLVNVERVDGAAGFVRTFTDRIDEYTIHVRGHPPGTLLGLVWLDRLRLAERGVVAALLVVAGASIAPATLLCAREVAGERVARRAAPFLVLAPAAIWVVTSFDALYAAVGAWGTYLIVSSTRHHPRRSDVYAFGGGAVLGAGLHMSYGLAPFLVIPAVVLVSRRRVRNVLVASAGGAGVFVAFASAGFWWFDGLAATRTAYLGGIAGVRPYWYFVFANIAVFAIVVGIGPVRGIGSLRDRRLWILCGAALVAVASADLSGLSKGEVERIWLPFWPWVGLAAAAIGDVRRHRWLAAQAAVAIAIQSLFFTSW